jgi:hypothetical protein
MSAVAGGAGTSLFPPGSWGFVPGYNASAVPAWAGPRRVAQQVDPDHLALAQAAQAAINTRNQRAVVNPFPQGGADHARMEAISKFYHAADPRHIEGVGTNYGDPRSDPTRGVFLWKHLDESFGYGLRGTSVTEPRNTWQDWLKFWATPPLVTRMDYNNNLGEVPTQLKQHLAPNGQDLMLTPASYCIGGGCSSGLGPWLPYPPGFETSAAQEGTKAHSTNQVIYQAQTLALEDNAYWLNRNPNEG